LEIHGCIQVGFSFKITTVLNKNMYRKGLNLRQAAYAAKKYKSHQRIPPDIMMDVNILLRGATG
jgi:hypothetical protein